MARLTWKRARDPLYRGDHRDRVGLPTPTADPSIVRHILYLEGVGRETPYLSTSEARDTAATFAGAHGRVWKTGVSTCEAETLGHISRTELLGLLRQKGHGKAKWTSALEVRMAQKYVEQWLEHLIDFTRVSNVGSVDLRDLVDRIFEAG